MFDFVQERKRVVQIVLALIVLPFAFWGMDSYRKSGGAAPVATVNGIKIGQQEFNNALNQQQQRIREMAGPNFDPTLFDKPEIKHSILEALVTQHLLESEAGKIGLVLPDQQLAQIIASIGAFQTDGKFDNKRYEAVLAEKGMNRLEFEARVRHDLITRQLTDSYAQNGYAAQTVVDTLIRLNEQQRVVSMADVDAAAYLKQVKLADGAVADYYKQNSAEFQVPERVKVDYVVFSADSLVSQANVSDDEIKQYYEDHVSDFGTQEQRQAAHILIAVAKNASDAEQQAAKAKAEQVLQQVKQAPGQFAALAKQYSQDPGSAANGGDLGMFGRGAMVKPFEDSVFSLKVGEISGLVQSEFGYHIIKLLAVKPAKVQPLNSVKAMIAQRLKAQHANDKFAELAEKFSNTVYEQSDSLKPAADLVKAQVQHGVWLSKGQTANGMWNDKALQAVFSDDALKGKRNTAAIEIAPNTLLAAHVTEYEPASVRPLVEVSASIQQKLLQQQAADMAQQRGEAFLAQLQRGEKVGVNWKTSQTLVRTQRTSVDPELLRAIFRADVQKLPAYVGVKGAGGYLLARIDAVKDAAPADDRKREAYAQQVRQITGEALLRAYLADAKKRADITMQDFSASSKN